MAREHAHASDIALEFDGQIFWYRRRFDPASDLCCLCREPIPEDEVPLILFREKDGETQQSRIHSDPKPGHEMSCTELLFSIGYLRVK